MIKIFRALVFATSTVLITSLAFAEGNSTTPPLTTSTVVGTVLDNNTGETLAGVAITLEGTDQKVYTDLDGNFTIKEIKPGTYNLIISMISYKNSLVENIVLLPNENEKMEIKLANK